MTTTFATRRRRSRRGAAAMILATVATATATTATTATAASGYAAPSSADVGYVPWSTYLPGWTEEFHPSSENDCVAGREPCLKATLKELSRIATETGKSCDHDAVFATSYLRMTQTYGWSRELPGYYQDVPFANHQGAVFAKYYTDAYTAYREGRMAAVPGAWRIAFDASRDRSVTGTGSLLLGMNAHINRDLAFVLAGVGLVAPDGSSRKRDYDKVEEWLYEATAPVVAELAARFDPRIDDAQQGSQDVAAAAFQFVSVGRENAWRNAERLVTAPTADERARVAASIEAEAEAIALSMRATYTTNPLSALLSRPSRDDWCSTHHGDAAPLSYPFGSPAPYGYK